MNNLLTFRSELERIPAVFEKFLAHFFQENAERYSYGDLFEPLYLDLAEFVGRRGKRIRPLLFLGAYRIFGGDRPLADRSVQLAALSLELLHAFILIHDDVIDQSKKRRGLPTFHKVIEERLGRLEEAGRIGQNVAIVMGDILFALAIDTLRATDFSLALRDEAIGRYLRTITDTGAGEVYDILLGVRDIGRVDLSQIECMYHLKTTKYTFEGPLVLGGLLAGAAREVLEELSDWIEPIGLAFQIQNDLLEYRQFKGVDRLQQTDLLEGKKTLLLRAAYERLNETDRSFLQICLSTRVANEASVSKIESLIDKSGAVEFLQKKMTLLSAKADATLAASSLSVRQRDGLQEMLAQIRQQVR